MRFLKNKILRAHQLLQKAPTKKPIQSQKQTIVTTLNLNNSLNILTSFPFKEVPSKASFSGDFHLDYLSEASTTVSSPLPPSQRKKRKQSKGQKKSPSNPKNSTKNVSINYGKAMVSFAISPLAVPYLESYLQDEALTLNEFILFAAQIKESITSIQGLRNLLIMKKSENDHITACKRVFKHISTIFIKYFSANWILHSKLEHKLVYLKYRFKMLRRIQNPELFTYIKRNW